MSLFRSFRLRIAILTAVVAGIVFGLFSIVAYSSIHNELEKNIDTRIMVEARQALGRGFMAATRRDRMTRQNDREGNQRIERSAASSTREPSQQTPDPETTEEKDTQTEAETSADDAMGLGNQIFASSIAEITETGRNVIYRSPNWPEELPTLASTYGEAKVIQPTEVNDLLRGRRSSPPDDRLRPPPRDPNREATRGSQPVRPDSAGSDNNRRPGGDRGGRGRSRWRGFFITKEPQFHYRTADGVDWRVGVFSSERHEVFVAASLSEFSGNVHKLRSAFAIAVPTAVIMIALGAWLVSGQAIRPIRHIANTAEKVTASGLSQRIPEPGTGDELQRLTVVLNSMLDRLEDGFKQATRFSADASHELKTPLTIMQGELEAALREAPSASPQQAVYASQLEEVTRLKRIVASLLLLSRADAGQLNLTRERINVSTNFADICEDAEILAEAADITLQSTVEPNLTIMGDRALLQQVFQNLISNAVKYNIPKGSIECSLRKDEATSCAVVEIKNTGHGIPEEDQSKVFRRFHRADAARSRDIDGFGLGLNLALEISRAHSGTLTLVKSDVESTIFRLTIPLA